MCIFYADVETVEGPFQITSVSGDKKILKRIFAKVLQLTLFLIK